MNAGFLGISLLALPSSINIEDILERIYSAFIKDSKEQQTVNGHQMDSGGGVLINHIPVVNISLFHLPHYPRKPRRY